MNQKLWKLPPVIKVYEALSCLADKRLKLTDKNQAQVMSSNRAKKYKIKYDPQLKAITANDNGSYWQGYLGYPAIAFLIQTKIIKSNPKITAWLTDINWHQLNQEYKRDYDKVIDFVLKKLSPSQQKQLKLQVENIITQIKNLKLKQLKPRLKLPA